VETTPENKQFGISYYTDISGIHGSPFTFTILSKSILCGKVDIVESGSVRHYWALRGFSESFMEFIRFIAEQDNLNKKSRMEVNC
jgi:hypothetical protein